MGEQISHPPPQRQEAPGIYGIMNNEAGGFEAWGAWGAWGKVIGKRCGNRYSAKVLLSYRPMYVQKVTERILRLAQLKDQWSYPILTSSVGTRSS